MSHHASPNHDSEKACAPPTTTGTAHDTSSTEQKGKPLAFYLSILLLGIIGFLVGLEATSVPVALPTISRDLNGTTFESFWVNISFILAITITQPLYASTSEVLGRKSLLYLSLVLFLAGSIMLGAAPNMAVAISGRLLQGFGGGGMDVLQVIILADVTTLRERPLYMGIEAAFIAAGACSGPILGGVFSSRVSWRWLGWINLPFLGIAFFLTFFFLRTKPIDLKLRAKLGRLDWTGMLLFAAGATTLALPLSWAGSLYSWSSWRTFVPLILGVLVLVGFAFCQRRAEEPVIPYRVFGNMTAAAGIASGFLHGLIMYAALLYVPLFFEAVSLENPLRAAVSSLPFCVCLVAFMAISGTGVSMLRRYRLVLWSGWIFSVLFLGLMCRVTVSTPRAEVYVYQALAGAGIGTVLTITAIPVQASVKRVDDTGRAAGLLVVFRLFGALIGLTVSSAAFIATFNARLDSVSLSPAALDPLAGTGQVVAFISSLRSVSISPDELESLREIYRAAFQAVWTLLTGASGLGFGISLFIKELSLENDDVGQQAFQS